MGSILLFATLIAVAMASLARPWIGVVTAYWFAILAPQFIWWYAFQNVRPVLFVTAPTVIGFTIALASGKLQTTGLKNKRVLALALLWVFFTLSYLFGPYVNVHGPWRFSDPDWVFSTFNKIFLLFFIACICIDDLKKLKALVLVVLVSGLYLIYWANDKYLSGQVFGRLAGPVDLSAVGIYSDENGFAMFFVAVTPFFWYAGLALKNVFMRWGMWLVVPLGWHAMFLTASRAGLLAVAASTLLVAIRSKKKWLGLLLIPALGIAYVWQAGDLMRDRAGTIAEYETETSASTRLEAWNAAIQMAKHHPFIGVGLGSFGPAFPDYSDRRPREAHNTFFQIIGESGVIAGCLFGFVVIATILGLWKNGRSLQNAESQSREDGHLYLINEATLSSFCGLLVCAMFMSLQMYEIVYFMFLMANAVLLVSAERARRIQEPVPIPSRQPKFGAATRARGPVRAHRGLVNRR